MPLHMHVVVLTYKVNAEYILFYFYFYLYRKKCDLNTFNRYNWPINTEIHLISTKFVEAKVFSVMLLYLFRCIYSDQSEAIIGIDLWRVGLNNDSRNLFCYIYLNQLEATIAINL